MLRSPLLDQLNYAEIRDNPIEVAILPMGATEPHNLHLPYGTDTFQVEILSQKAAEAANAQGAKVVVLPAIPYGTETNLRAFPLAINLNPSTITLMIKDILESLTLAGIHKLLILNGHGGNDFKPMLREFYGQTPVHLFLCDWFRGLSADLQKSIFENPGDHAGEAETALGLAYFPQHVACDPQTGKIMADAGAMRATALESINRGWISITRPWHLLTTNTGAGNPHPATAEKGRQLMEGMISRLSEFLMELSALPLSDHFPYPPKPSE